MPIPMPDACEIYQSEIGEIEVASISGELLSCTFSPLYSSLNLKPDKSTREIVKQLKSYFKGELKDFDLPVQYTGTELQIQAMKSLQKISFGQTLSYSKLAELLNIPSGSRAVGNLIGKNPVLIIVPCHRVVGTNGKITGYAGGLERKRWLLAHELNNSISADRLF